MTFNKLTCLPGNLIRHNPVSPLKPFHHFYWEQSWSHSLKLTGLLCGINDCSMFWEKGTILNPKKDASQEHFLCPAPYLSEVKIQTREPDLMTVAQTQNTMGKMVGGRTYKMSDIVCPFVYTLFRLPWEIWFLISHPPNSEHLITFLIELVLSILGATQHQGRRDRSETSYAVEASFPHLWLLHANQLPRNPKSNPHLLEILLFDAEEADTWRGSKSGACVGQWQHV